MDNLPILPRISFRLVNQNKLHISVFDHSSVAEFFCKKFVETEKININGRIKFFWFDRYLAMRGTHFEQF